MITIFKILFALVVLGILIIFYESKAFMKYCGYSLMKPSEVSQNSCYNIIYQKPDKTGGTSLTKALGNSELCKGKVVDFSPEEIVNKYRYGQKIMLKPNSCWLGHYKGSIQGSPECIAIRVTTIREPGERLASLACHYFTGINNTCNLSNMGNSSVAKAQRLSKDFYRYYCNHLDGGCFDKYHMILNTRTMSRDYKLLEELMCTKVVEENENMNSENIGLRWAEAVSEEEIELYQLALQKRKEIYRISRKYGLKNFGFRLPTCLKKKIT